MNLSDLSDRLGRTHDVLRVETFGAYHSASDQDWLQRYLAGEPQPDLELKRPWLDRLAAARDRGHPWKRLRLVPDPITDYFRYCCEWSYRDNVTAGEDVRILDPTRAPRLHAELAAAGDFLVLDGEIVLMHYDAAGAFHSATEAELDHWWAYESDAQQAWPVAATFTDWWADHPHLHRNLVGI